MHGKLALGDPMAHVHILLHWPFWPISNLANPQANTPKYGPGGSASLPGATDLNGIFRTFRPTMASTAHGPWDNSGPFWPNSNEAKRGQGGSPSAHLSLFWPKDPKNPKLAQGPKAHRMAITSRLKPRPLAITRGHQPPSIRGFPSRLGKILAKLNGTKNIIFFYSLYIFEPLKSQARTEAVLTPTPRVPLDGTPVVPQLRPHSERGPVIEGEAPSRKEGRGPRISISFSGVVGWFPGLSRTTFKDPGEDGGEEESSVEEEESYGTESVPAPVGASQGTGGPTLAQSNQPVSHQSETSLLAIMQQMTQIMANLQEA
ncbi:hypothetical protein O181_011748 [Austropuccinia psidii MF-1]|uniref:Uncharacterized protein n=1 Tax=Austropuccinia psidii MF-1 TaxID=1389203 RepID=A0A9Q3BVV9_9BASI|nr:hypothetical protein [Austropuccinia psidii MF-1]